MAEQDTAANGISADCPRVGFGVPTSGRACVGTPPTTYSVRLAAEGWLADDRRLIESGGPISPTERAPAPAAGQTITIVCFVQASFV
jgi:hypothetical protein